MISTANLKAYLGITGTEDDTLLGLLEPRAVAIFQDMTGRYFGANAQAFTDILSSAGGTSFWTSEPPASGTLVVSTRSSINSAWEVVTSTYYEVLANTVPASPHGGREVQRIDGGSWPAGYRLIKAAYQSGYTAGSEPKDVLQAIYDLVGYLYRHRAQATSSFTDDAVPISPRFFPRSVWDAANRWKTRRSGWEREADSWAC